jgi:DNA-binding NarL/FixJ family response regulator
MILPQNHISLSGSNFLKNILAPLTQLSDIHYFHYGVNFPDNSVFSLSTNSQYLESWYTSQFPHCGFHLSEGWHLWNTHLPQKQLEVAENLDIGHGIHLVRHQKEKTEVFGFASHCDNRKIYDFYLNQSHLLKKFTQYFLEEAKELITIGQAQLIVPPPKMILKDENLEKISYKQNDLPAINSFYQKINHPFRLLSKRESECFGLLIQGISSTAIGHKLGLSSKTVYVYIDRIKQKLGCHNKEELIIKAQEAGLIEYYLFL